MPIDDTNTLSVGWFFTRVPQDREPYVQNSIPYWYSPIIDEKTGRWITSHIMNQDFVGWVGQGAITDRKREHLGRSDRGIIMMRQRFFARPRHGRGRRRAAGDRARSGGEPLH